MDNNEFQKIVNKLGDRILAIRKEKGYSQQELSYQSGIEKPYIRKIEKGRTNPTIKTLLKLSISLDTPICDFFKEE